MPDPWFPDYVCRWYDEFQAGYPYEEIDRWERGGVAVSRSWKPRFKRAPNDQAAAAEVFLQNGTGTRAERLFHLLRIASDLFKEIGFRFVRENGGSGWRSIRSHWVKTGNLLRFEQGHLLPREVLPYDWAWTIDPPRHTTEGHFQGFVRWHPTVHLKNLLVRVSVVPATQVPALPAPLRIAVVPLVARLADFDVVPDDSDPNFPRFRMGLKSPDDLTKAVVRALQSSIVQECDIVVFPELCFTPPMQQYLGGWMQGTATERPWLVVAGSAHTPLPGAGAGFHNKALVFDNRGNLILSHHKLNRYSISVDEEGRYGLAEAFKYLDRTEDMVTTPNQIEVVDTPAGRFGVLICEDLAVEDFVSPLIRNLGLDWLLVPILDGCQTDWRWPAHYGRKYAERGAAVVIATSLSLVEQHRLQLPAGTPRGVGLVITPASRPKVQVLVSDRHDFAVVHEIVAGD